MEQETQERQTTNVTVRRIPARVYWLSVIAIAILVAAVLYFYPRKQPLASQKSLPSLTTNEDTLEQVILSNTSVVRNGVALATVESKNFSTEINAVGILEVPEPGERTISAWARGRIEHLYVSASGEYVRKGEPLYDFYSPDILNAEHEYLIAKQGDSRAGAAGGAMPGMNMNANGGLVKAAAERLRLYGLSAKQIEQIGTTGTLVNTVTISAPEDGIILRKLSQEGAYVNEGTSMFQLADLSMVWAEVQVPLSEIRFIRLGETISIQTEEYPNESFNSRVILISPVADQASHTVRVRLELRNPDYKLRPGMTFVSQVSIPLGKSLAIPQDAVIRTGNGDFVWVSDGGYRFTSKMVTLGELSPDDYYQVVNGLNAGDNVAAQGAFLVDAEYQLSKNNPMSGMNMGETGIRRSGEGTATVRAIDPAKQMITLDHGTIPGVMPAMTMTYKVSNPQFLTIAQPGESVRFTLTRQSDGTFEITTMERE